MATGDGAVRVGPSRRAIRGVAAAWGVALLVAWCVVLGNATDEPDMLCPGARTVEASSLATHFRLWPPGVVDCDYTAPDGRHVRTAHVLWREWAATLVFAGVLGASIVVLTSGRRRRGRRR